MPNKMPPLHDVIAPIELSDVNFGLELKNTSSFSAPQKLPTPPSLFSLRSARLYVALTLFVYTFTIALARTVLASAVVCMLEPEHELVDNYTVSLSVSNETVLEEIGECTLSEKQQSAYEGNISWTSDQVAHLFSILFWTSILTALPSGWFADRFGARMLIIISTVITMTATVLMAPAAIYLPFWVSMMLRGIVGFAYGAYMPSIMSFVPRWFPQTERCTVTTIWCVGNPLGSMVAYLLAPLFCNSTFLGGWPMIFYSVGVVGVVTLAMVLLLLTNSPNTHRWIGKDELQFLTEQMGGEQFGSRAAASKSIPWRKLLLSKELIVSIINTYTGVLLYMSLTFYMPLYLKTALGLDIQSNGLLGMFAMLSLAVGCVALTYLSHVIRKYNLMTHTNTCKIIHTVGMCFCSILLIIMTFTNCSQRTYAIAILIIAMSTVMANIPGLVTALACIAPAYTGVVTSVNRVGAVVGGALGPIIVDYFITTGSQEEWRWAFGVIGGQTIVAALLFGVYGTADPLPWALPPKQSSAGHLNQMKLKVISETA